MLRPSRQALAGRFVLVTMQIGVAERGVEGRRQMVFDSQLDPVASRAANVAERVAAIVEDDQIAEAAAEQRH